MIGSIDINHHQVKQDEVPKAPGMKYKHYAPNAQVYIVDPADDWGEVAAVIAQSKEQVGLMGDRPSASRPRLVGSGRSILPGDGSARGQRPFV